MLTNYAVLDDYIKKCTQKIEYHSKNAKSARLWNNVLSTANIFLSAACAFTMTILSVEQSPSFVITIVGSGYAMIITITSKIKESFNFDVLNVLHNNAMDSYSDVKMDLEKLKRDQEYHPHLLESAIQKYEAVVQKSHVQSIKECHFYFCLKIN